MRIDEMTLDELNVAVTDIIFEIMLEKLVDEAAHKAAYSKLSEYEEAIAGRLPKEDPEGAIARRGAIRAAEKAGRPDRAKALFDRYSIECRNVSEVRTLLQSSSES